jgi:UDP-glucose 4-epimerase
VPGGRRAGDAVSVVALPNLIKNRLGWEPVNDDLDEIVRSALSWEASLSRRNLR